MIYLYTNVDILVRLFYTYSLFLFLLWMFLQTLFVSAQPRSADSLQQLAPLTSSESERLHASVLSAQDMMPANMDSARVLLESAGSLEGSREIYHLAQYFNTWGLYYWYRMDRKLSIQWYQKTLAMPVDPGILRFQAAAANNIGNHFFRLGEPDSTKHYLMMSFDIDSIRGNKEGMAKTMYDLSRMYCSQNQYELSLRYINDAIRLQLELDDLLPLLRFYNVLGINYTRLNQFEKAAEAYQTSYAYASRLDMPEGRIIFYSNMSALLNNSALRQDLQEYLPDTVLYYTQKGLTLAGETQFTEHVVALLSNEAQAIFNAGDPAKALGLFKDAMEYIREFGVVHFEMEVAYRMGIVYRSLNMMAEARQLQERSLELAVARKSPLRQSEALFEIATLDSLEGNYLGFARNYAKAVAYRDSVWNNEHRLRIAELQIIHEIELKDQEIIRLNRINRLNLILQYLTIGIIVLFIMLLIYIKRSNKKSRQIGLQKLQIAKQEKDLLTLELQTNRRELTGKALSLAKSEEMMTSMRKDVQALVDKEGRIPKEISSILQNLNTRDSSKALWKDFEMRFEELSDGFITRLTSRYPDLSPAEIRLCAMLRLQMTSKEMAEMIRRSPRTIEHTRNRVRRKVDLGPNETLLQHILNI